MNFAALVSLFWVLNVVPKLKLSYVSIKFWSLFVKKVFIIKWTIYTQTWFSWKIMNYVADHELLTDRNVSDKINFRNFHSKIKSQFWIISRFYFITTHCVSHYHRQYICTVSFKALFFFSKSLFTVRLPFMRNQSFLNFESSRTWITTRNLTATHETLTKIPGLLPFFTFTIQIKNIWYHLKLLKKCFFFISREMILNVNAQKANFQYFSVLEKFTMTYLHSTGTF